LDLATIITIILISSIPIYYLFRYIDQIQKNKDTEFKRRKEAELELERKRQKELEEKLVITLNY